ncbi:hypothetical protein ACIP1G_14855 [Pseudomonas sp. NPDC089392]|uniref:hypothetical protein n=1 Tax=Pseudomonas sp. NPDC089392 TaxID=3364459 RepID=UPI0037F7CF4E
MDQQINILYANSFRGQFYLRSTTGNIPLRLSRSSDKWNWGFTPEDDWLQVGGRQDSPVMHFHFHSRTDDRLHYHISIPGHPATKTLGISRNGYLGFYWNAEVTDYWKIEPLKLTDEGLVCHLRDHRGHRVGTIKDAPHHNGGWVAFLNVEEGNVFTFLLKQVG